MLKCCWIDINLLMTGKMKAWLATYFLPPGRFAGGVFGRAPIGTRYKTIFSHTGHEQYINPILF